MKIYIRFQNLDNPISLSQNDQTFASRLLVEDVPWDGEIKVCTLKNAKYRREELKEKIKRKLLRNQGEYCIYCGLHFEISPNPEIDHIALKSRFKEQSFEPENLVLACQTCNGRSRKGKRHIVIDPNAGFVKENYKIIHPYWDDMFDHIEFSVNDSDLLLSVKDSSEKGDFNIKVFKLMDTGPVILRGGLIMRMEKGLGLAKEKLIERIVLNPPSPII
ncbi:MAG: HNH endonuclease [Bacteroidia bacterium]|nr:HNH endonuclease [Bacteroidia bacterium]